MLSTQKQVSAEDLKRAKELTQRLSDMLTAFGEKVTEPEVQLRDEKELATVLMVILNDRLSRVR